VEEGVEAVTNKLLGLLFILLGFSCMLMVAGAFMDLGIYSLLSMSSLSLGVLLSTVPMVVGVSLLTDE